MNEETKTDSLLDRDLSCKTTEDLNHDDRRNQNLA